MDPTEEQTVRAYIDFVRSRPSQEASR